jgi:2-C-methyl-D-erythritol 4-phosphate cytidylyltransferase/2-C-methyl-D-erythritol 2,4-cyclodiphosphate synthase
MFIGTGWDIHKHSNSKPLTLGGVVFDEDGFEAHSDGDILLHALIDSILGATANKDIGHYFPSNEKTPQNISSSEMLKVILEEINFTRFKINNIDMTIISQKINISSKRGIVEDNISKLLSIEKTKINLKGKSVDKIGIIGNNEASAALVSILLVNA